MSACSDVAGLMKIVGTAETGIVIVKENERDHVNVIVREIATVVAVELRKPENVIDIHGNKVVNEVERGVRDIAVAVAVEKDQLVIAVVNIIVIDIVNGKHLFYFLIILKLADN